MTTSPVVFRFSRRRRLWSLAGVALFAGALAHSLWFRFNPMDGDWRLAILLCLLGNLYDALMTWTTRYEFSGVALSWKGVLSRRPITLAQLREARLASDGIRLEGNDGAVLTVPTVRLEGGEQLRALLEGAAASVPLQELKGSVATYNAVRSLSCLAAVGGVVSLLCAVVGGLSGLALRGCVAGTLLALWIQRALKAQEKGKDSSAIAFGLWAVIVFIGVSLGKVDHSPMLLHVGAFHGGLLYAVSLTLLPYQKRLIAYLERGAASAPLQEQGPAASEEAA